MTLKNGGKRVLLIDDAHLCRTLFAAGLRRDREFTIYEASDPEGALKQAAELAPDVIFLNLTPRNYSGMALLQCLHRQFPKIGLLAFSYQCNDYLYAERAICAGAAGYISADESGASLMEALLAIAAGGVYLNPLLRKKICAGTDWRRREKESPFDRLSHREFEVFCLTGHGHVPKKIADMLKVSVKTIETYRERIRIKLGLSDGGELLFQAACFIREQSLSRLSPE